jgi:hypothetical protein
MDPAAPNQIVNFFDDLHNFFTDVSFARLTLIDRTEDLITPFITPSTYLNLIDEFFGIIDNEIEFQGNQVSLDDQDALFLFI